MSRRKKRIIAHWVFVRNGGTKHIILKQNAPKVRYKTFGDFWGFSVNFSGFPLLRALYFLNV